MKKHYFIFPEGSVINQVICAVLINFQVFMYGAAIGWMSPMTLLLQSEESPRGEKLSDIEISWMAASAYLVCVPTSYLIGYMGDKYGRKFTVIFVSVVNASTWIIKLCSLQTWAFILARSLVGVIMSGAYVNCPMYTKEISQDNIRGQLGSFVTTFHIVGNLFMYVMGDMLTYNVVLWMSLAITVFHTIIFLTMPETPSYLVKHGKRDEAARVLSWLRCRPESHPVIIQELEALTSEQDKDAGTSTNLFKNILADKILFRCFLIALLTVVARDLCGIIPITNFAGDIFQEATRDVTVVISPNQQAMILGAMQFVGAIVALLVVESIGRKPLLLSTCIVSGISMFIAASWFLATYLDYTAPLWIPVTTLCVCIFSDASGLQPASVIIINEIFSFKYRGTILATSFGTSAIIMFLQVLFFKPVATSLGLHVSLYSFAFICIAYTFYVLFKIPETKMKTLDEIHEKLKTKKERAAEAAAKANSQDGAQIGPRDAGYYNYGADNELYTVYNVSD